MNVPPKTEDYHHTREQVGGYLDDALAICRDRGIDPETAPQIVAQLIATFASKQIFYTQTQPLSPALLDGIRRGP